MDQPIDRILIPRDKSAIAVMQTRKYLGLWDIRSNKFMCSLVTNQFGSVINDCAITNDGKLVVCVESDQLLVWDLKTQSVRQRLPAAQVHQLFLLYSDKMIGVLFKQLDTNEQKVARIIVYRLSDLAVFFTYEFQCRHFRDIIVLKDTTTIIAVVYSKGHDQIQVISVNERAVKHKFRPRAIKKQSKEMDIHRMLPIHSNPNHLVLMDTESRGAVWDIKNKKIIRHLPAFTGVLTQDGKLGLNAPNKGGLHIIDMKTGGVMRTLIGQVAEGVNDVKAMFTSTGEHVLYYHSGHQTLRAFRVADGQLIGTFRPHARITTWSSDSSGERIVIGGQDGSLLTAFLYDEKVHPEAQRSLASLPSRRYLAELLGITVDETDESENIDVRNLTIVTKAVQKFKNLTVKNQNSAVCSIQ